MFGFSGGDALCVGGFALLEAGTLRFQKQEARN
jgi:hypothetical protein